MASPPLSQHSRATVCLQCGDVGEKELLVYCRNCRDSCIHPYCMEVITLNDDDIRWWCWDCRGNDIIKAEPPRKSERISFKRKEAQTMRNYLKQKLHRKKKLVRISNDTSETGRLDVDGQGLEANLANVRQRDILEKEKPVPKIVSNSERDESIEIDEPTFTTDGKLPDEQEDMLKSRQRDIMLKEKPVPKIVSNSERDESIEIDEPTFITDSKLPDEQEDMVKSRQRDILEKEKPVPKIVINSERDKSIEIDEPTFTTDGKLPDEQEEMLKSRQRDILEKEKPVPKIVSNSECDESIEIDEPTFTTDSSKLPDEQEDMVKSSQRDILEKEKPVPKIVSNSERDESFEIDEPTFTTDSKLPDEQEDMVKSFNEIQAIPEPGTNEKMSVVMESNNAQNDGMDVDLQVSLLAADNLPSTPDTLCRQSSSELDDSLYGEPVIAPVWRTLLLKSLRNKVMELRRESSLPQIWAIEALACSNHVEASLLLDLLKKTPQIINDIGKNATELVSLKILESLFIQGSPANPVSSALSKKVRLDPSDHCEDVLRRILSETSLSHLKSSGSEISKWDLEPFIEHKKTNLRTYALKQLKDAILTGSFSFLASLKEKSCLPVGTHTENQAPANGNCIAPTVEGSNTDDGNLMPSDLPDESLIPVNRKRRAGESHAEQCCTTCINPEKKNKHDIISNEQYVGGQLISSGVHTKIKDASLISVLVDPNKVLPGGKKVPHCDSELNNNSEEQQRQDENIEEEGAKNEACGHKITNDNVDGVELHMKNVDEVEENVHFSNDNDGTGDGKIDIARKENACIYTQDSLETTNSRDQRLLADASERYSEENCSLVKETCVEVMRQNGSPGDGNNQCNSSKGLVGSVLNENLDAAMQNSKDENTENRGEGFHGLISTNKDTDKVYNNVPRTATTDGEAEDVVDISSDNDGYHDERTTIDRKKKSFLSSQCSYNQDLLAATYKRELHVCMKCHKGGSLLSCIADSCPIVIHESCLGSDKSFNTRETFYCPFCAYSQAISKCIDVKKYVSLARKDLSTFICLGPRNESNKESSRSLRMDGNCLKQTDGLPENNEPNQINVVEKVSNHQCRTEMEHEQPFGRNAADVTDRLVQPSKSNKQDGKGIRQESQSPRAHRGKSVAVKAVHKSQSETKSCKVSETSGSEKHADGRSKTGVTRPPETDLPCYRTQCPQSTDAEEISENENEDSGASKNFVRVRKNERLNLYPAKSQLRKKRLPWTSKEEDILQKGVHKFCSPHDKTIPWKMILKNGEGEFHPSRSTTDLKDKWRNMCKTCPKSK